MKTFVKDQSDIQEGNQMHSIHSLEADQPTITNVVIKAKREAGSDDEYTCEIEVRLDNVAGAEGSSFSVNIACSENSDFDITIEGDGSEPSPVDQAVMTSVAISTSISAEVESYSFTVILSEDGEEIETEVLTADIYYDFSE